MAAEPVGQSPRTYTLWEREPAPNRGAKRQRIGYPYDRAWEYWSYPLGNGYIGANLFGRTDTERVQITDKTMQTGGQYKFGNLTSFAELYLDFGHKDCTHYRRSLVLNTALAEVDYEADGVRYTRQYFVSYPDKVLVIRLTADRDGALSLRIRAEIPYLKSKEKIDHRSGKVAVDHDLITLSGTADFFRCNYEGQIKVLNEGGTLSSDEKGIAVTGADSVTILLATGTNYRLSPEIFLKPPQEKLDPTLYPHDEVSTTIRRAVEKGYTSLLADHLKDYQSLFGRVAINLNSEVSPLPTSKLLEAYKRGKTDTYLEELVFQYGRYLLIASSREKSLPANLQGTWSQYEQSPWSGGYWHNINVQMNYWGAMSANLAETFEAYIHYFEAYLPQAKAYARQYIEKHHPDLLGDSGVDCGWILGTGANPYFIGQPGGHSGPGTGGFTAKLLMDYYLFTGDKTFLEEIVFPAMLSLSRFYSKALVQHGDLLLVEPSASPEQVVPTDPPAGQSKPGSTYYVTVGCTFDQGFVWETFNDTLALARELKREDPFLKTIEAQMARLDPIIIGESGQIKEYREETTYSSIGNWTHRHISQLCPLFPGTLINSEHPQWMKAAAYTLDQRGNKTTGWALAHRMNCRARLMQGEDAHEIYRTFIAERVVPNLWSLHPPFQIDGSLGTMAGVAEMLLQSHEGDIHLLPALPNAWKNGMFNGLVARGNYVVSAKWMNSRVSEATLLSRNGGTCTLRYPGMNDAVIRDQSGTVIAADRKGNDRVSFPTQAGMLYRIELGHPGV